MSDPAQEKIAIADRVGYRRDGKRHRTFINNIESFLMKYENYLLSLYQSEKDPFGRPVYIDLLPKKPADNLVFVNDVVSLAKQLEDAFGARPFGTTSMTINDRWVAFQESLLDISNNLESIATNWQGAWFVVFRKSDELRISLSKDRSPKPGSVVVRAHDLQQLCEVVSQHYDNSEEYSSGYSPNTPNTRSSQKCQ